MDSAISETEPVQDLHPEFESEFKRYPQMVSKIVLVGYFSNSGIILLRLWAMGCVSFLNRIRYPTLSMSKSVSRIYKYDMYEF